MVVVPADRVVNEALSLFDVIEDSLKLHLVRWVGRCFCVSNNINNRFADKNAFFCTTVGLAAFVGAGHRSLALFERSEWATDGWCR